MFTECVTSLSGFKCFVLIFCFHFVIGVGRLTVQQEGFYASTLFHHAYAIPSTKFFSSGCCSPTLSCHRQLHLYPKFLNISHRENGSFEVLSLQILIPSSRSPVMMSDLSCSTSLPPNGDESTLPNARRIRSSSEPYVPTKLLKRDETSGQRPGDATD